MTNINAELFKRYKPENKLAIIEKLTQDELFSVSEATMLRIIKEAGCGRNSGQSRNKFKTLYLRKRVGNDWNSTVESIWNGKGNKVYLDVYVQGDDTDTIDSCDMSDFLSKRYDRVCCGRLKESFSNGYEQTVPANYCKDDRASVIREILRSYVYAKYNI